MFDVVLSLDGIANVVELFEVNQPLQSVSFGEAVDKPRAVFEHSTDQIIRPADVKNAVRAICQNINLPACHVDILQDVDGRERRQVYVVCARQTTMPGHDELECFDA
jgi:hypothetical protein